MAHLVVIQGNDRGKQFELDGETASIGRDPKSAVCLKDQEISRHHAVIKSIEGGRHMIFDQQSSNGTFINDRRLNKHMLDSRDLVRVGQTILLYETGSHDSDIDPRDKVRIKSEADDSASKIVETISAKVTLPSLEEDSQITDSFLEHLEENIHVIYHTAVATSRFTDIDELHQKVLQLIFDWVKADRGCILLLDEESGEVTAGAFRQRDPSLMDPIDVSRSIVDYVRQRNEGVLTSDIHSDERWTVSSGSPKEGVYEAMCVPMQGRMGIVGFVYVDNFIPRSQSKKKKQAFEQRFSRQQLKMLLAVAHQAALATENATYYRAMTQNAQLAAVGETFTQIAHHMRNLLQGLDGAKNRVNMGIDHDEMKLIKEGWAEIEPITTRIYNLSLNLLSFSKPREPILSVDSLNDSIVDVVNQVEKRAEADGILIDWEPNLEIKPFAFDAEAIYRAVLNVVQNAIDACSRGCVVKIRVTQVNNMSQISVIDDGEGIDPQKIKHIFKPFASTKGQMGTGVGLPVALKTLREHGGDIEVASTMGHGTRFTLHLPMRRIKSKASHKPADTSMHSAHDVHE